MMILKYALVGLVLLGGVNTFAQEEEKSADTQTEVKQKKTAEEKAEHKMTKLTEKLSLTDEQVSEIKPLLLDLMNNIKETKANESLTADAKKAKVKSFKEVFSANVEAKLDESQKEKFAELKAEHEAKVAEKKANKKTPGEHAAELTEEMTELLSLTTEQEEKVRILNLKVANKIQAIKDNDSMTKEKKKEFIKGNKGDHKNEMTGILTADQLVTYEAWLTEKKAAHKEKKAVKKQELKVSE